ncbi:hypothetical protein KSP39_PZI003694 [Platanthera zijinensis]|uniref:Uncharacterized protein n=1 Tax=Platanthera zijinensis TaxID=2320716 RepID=A0AAP0BYQ5_9ASPA
MMRPGDLTSFLPLLPPPPPSIHDEWLAEFQREVDALKTRPREFVEALRVKEEVEWIEREKQRSALEAAEKKMQEMQAALELERKEKLELQKALQDQVAEMTARLEKEKEINRRLDDDLRHYRGKYLDLSREADKSERPVAPTTERSQQPSRLTTGEISNPPEVAVAGQVAASGELEARALQMIPFIRVERDVSRVHQSLHSIHHLVSQIYVILLQTDEQVARIGREGPESDKQP